MSSFQVCVYVNVRWKCIYTHICISSEVSVYGNWNEWIHLFCCKTWKPMHLWRSSKSSWKHYYRKLFMVLTCFIAKQTDLLIVLFLYPWIIHLYTHLWNLKLIGWKQGAFGNEFSDFGWSSFSEIYAEKSAKIWVCVQMHSSFFTVTPKSMSHQGEIIERTSCLILSMEKQKDTLILQGYNYPMRIPASKEFTC